MVKFILKSYLFRRFLIITPLFIILLILSSIIFDALWGSNSSIPVISQDEIYAPPLQYDNFNRLNLKMVPHDLVAIEGNKKFRLKDENKNFEFYDTVKVYYPNEEFDKVNKIFLQFEDSQFLDSIYFVNSHSEIPSIFYKQIFYSSVIINKLNEFSENPVKFRIDQSKLVSNELLENNDSLINKVLNYFNLNIDKLGLAECGRNSMVFKKICNDYSVPCRIVNLQGGDVDQVGFDE